MRAILTYHSIDGSGSPISCDAETFARHVRWFASGHVEVSPLEDLVALPATANAVAITFDDAYENVAQTAIPQLVAHGLPCTVFVVADRVGSTNSWDRPGHRSIPRLPLLDWDALGRLSAQGVAIGSHGCTHADLTRLAPSRMEAEVAGAAEVIAQRIGRRPTVFAYPYGRLDDGAARAVTAVYRYGCTAEFRLLDQLATPARLPRLDTYYFREPGLLEFWGTPRFDRFVRRRRWLRLVRETARTIARGPR